MAFTDRLHNRGSISTGYDIDNSLKFESDNTESMNRTPSSSGNRKTWTVSFWFKRTELGATVRLFEAWDGTKGTSSLFTDTDLFILDLNTASNYFTSSQVFRDTSAWYHFVVRVDTTSATDSERVRVYVNGSELVGSWTGGYIGQNTDLTWNQNVVHYLGVFHASSQFANGYYAEVINVDGTSLAPTEFGEFDEDSGIWKPKAYEGTYGTNGFYLDFENSGSLGADSSGNGHTWTLDNITAADQATDTPTNNFCTLNILEPDTSNQLTYTEGATKVTSLGASPYPTSKGTLGVQNGKWYFELKAGTMNYSSQVGAVGLALPEHISASYPHDNAGAYVYRSNGDKLTQGSTTSYGDAWSTNDIIGVAIDLDNNTLSFYRNNTSQGQAFTGLTETYLPAIYTDGTTLEVNFGGYTSFSISSAASDANGYGTFEYAPPSGYYALCTKNLAEYG